MKIECFVILFVLFATVAFAQDSTKFTQDEFNLIVNYMQRGSIPALSDSSTMASVQTLKAKLDAVLTRKRPLVTFTINDKEKNVVNYLMRADVESALALLRLQQKLAPPEATNNKSK